MADITFTEYRPSVIAASALLAASFSLYPAQFDNFKIIIENDRHVNEFKDDVTACLNKMTAMCKEKNIVMKTADLEPRERMRDEAGPSEPLPPTPNELIPPPPPPPPSPDREIKGKAKIGVTAEIKKEAPILHTEGETSEIQEEPESKQGPQMDFKLKWVTNENEDVTLNSPRFRAVVPAEQAENEDVDKERAAAPKMSLLTSCCPQ